MPKESIESPIFDQGHRGDVDYTQIAKFLAMSPAERLERHEGWRLFVKEALRRARLSQQDDRTALAGPG